MVEVPALRGRLLETVGVDGAAQIVLRMGHAAAPRPTPRRRLDAFIDP